LGKQKRNGRACDRKHGAFAGWVSDRAAVEKVRTPTKK
jgi:hypothetical protein